MRMNNRISVGGMTGATKGNKGRLRAASYPKTGVPEQVRRLFILISGLKSFIDCF